MSLPPGRTCGSDRNSRTHRWGSALAAILLANTVVALQYGVIFPILPQLVELRVADGGNVALHTGLIAATYPLALFVCAPLWGRWSDAHNPALALAVALAGFSATFALWFVPQSLGLLYTNRLLSGAFAAAVFPTSQVIVAELTTDLRQRARTFSWLSIALNLGYLVGPAIGGWFGGIQNGAAALRATAITMAILAAVSAAWLWRTSREGRTPAATLPATATSERDTARAERTLLVLTALTAVAIATFEVGISLTARTEMHSSSHLGGLMTLCMVVMILAQALVFNSRFPARETWRLIAPCFLVVAVALPLFGGHHSPAALFAGTAVMAASTGILFPVIAYWTSLVSTGRGLAFGRQMAAANLGQMVGSATIGLLAATPSAGPASYIPAGLAALAAAMLGMRLRTTFVEISRRMFADP